MSENLRRIVDQMHPQETFKSDAVLCCWSPEVTLTWKVWSGGGRDSRESAAGRDDWCRGV